MDTSLADTTGGLPQPGTLRWCPLRSGLLNLYRYEEQEFHFTKGRLLLRGNNGTGKSRVLALQFPFLLDGDIRSHRVEPDADSAKRMVWNVLTDDHDHRTGYTWLEFGRLQEDGTPEYLTLGCGLHGVRGRDLKRWYFLTPRRVGDTLFLRTAGRFPLTREQLRDALEDSGTLFDGHTEYRQAVNDHLFQLPPERYDALLELLIQLRQPQLSRQLDEQRLSDALSNSLAPLDEALINVVAESFRQLEDDRDALANDEQALDAVTRFLEVYARYARVVSTRRAGELRDAHNRYESTQRAANSVEETLQRATAKQEALQQELRDHRTDLEGRKGEERALRADPKMKTAERLERLHEDAHDAANREAQARREEQESRSEFALRDRAAQKAAADATQAGLAARQAKSTAAQQAERIHARAAFEQLPCATPEKLHPAIQKFSEEKQRAVNELQRLAATTNQVRAEEQRAREMAAQQRERCDHCVEESERRRRDVNRAREEHLHAFATWRKSLRELRLTNGDELTATQADWCETLNGPEPLRSALARAQTEQRNHSAAERADCERQQHDLAERRALIDAERARLEAGADQEPPAPHTRSPGARGNRSGAPFWRCVEFQPHLSPEQRSGIEAALEAAGILDAWLDAAGTLRRPSDGDALLDPAQVPPCEGESLAAWLCPDTAASDRSESVAAVLSCIAAGQRNTGIWITQDGTWANGLLTGRWLKPAAAYIGAASREQARQQRLRELADEADGIEAEARRVAERLEAVQARDQRADREAESCPDSEPVRETERRMRSAMEKLEGEQALLLKCEETLGTCRGARETAETNLRRTAEDLGLLSWLEDLDGLQTAVHQCLVALERMRSALLDAARSAAEAARTEGERDQARERCSLREQQLARAQEESSRRRHEVEMLQATAGKDASEIRERLSAVVQAIAAAEKEMDRLSGLERSADRERVRCATQHERLAEELSASTAARQQARETFEHFVALGLLEVAGVRDDLKEITDWSMTRMVEMVRGLAKDWGESVSEKELDEAGNALTRSFQSLQTALSPQNYQPATEQLHGASVVSCEYHGQRRSIRELHSRLSNEVVERKKVLAAREVAFIERYLVGDVSDQLHRLIGDARELIRNMNAEIEKCAMSTGMRLRLSWAAADDAPAGLKQAEANLARQQSLLTADERKQLADFLQDRIEQEKRDNEGGTWIEHLSNAVDYRRWHRFSIERQQNGKWTRLTRRTHGTGSGGEKAMLLTIPQFAAAAAHYHSIPYAPRLIMLDEAFVGIDSDMRSKCMGLIHHFDLDVVMTSEREWGCYDSIDGLSICQLATHPQSPAIAVSHWRWNGRRKEAFDVQANPPPPDAAEEDPENGDLFGS